jgi:hypothetical protein
MASALGELIHRILRVPTTVAGKVDPLIRIVLISYDRNLDVFGRKIIYVQNSQVCNILAANFTKKIH